MSWANLKHGFLGVRLRAPLEGAIATVAAPMTCVIPFAHRESNIRRRLNNQPSREPWKVILSFHKPILYDSTYHSTLADSLSSDVHASTERNNPAAVVLRACLHFWVKAPWQHLTVRSCNSKVEQHAEHDKTWIALISPARVIMPANPAVAHGLAACATL
eukprot:370886-Amphidinium_carterae.1